MTSLKNFNLQHSYIFPFQTISIYFPIFLFLFISLFLSPLSLSAQSNNHIFGIVTDSLTGEALIGATVAELSSNKATATNNYGYYSLPTTSANPTVQISSMGYNSLSMVINVEANTQTNIKLQPANLQLEEAMVVGKRTSVASPSLGKITFTKENIEHIPVFLGESDLMKALQIAPGISASKEGSSEVAVRGGGVDQNLTLLDGAPVYNLNHALGLLSVFNTEVIKDVSLYKGGVPARYGGRASSVIDVVGREGSNKSWKGTASVSTIAMGATVEGPIVKDKISFIVSARRSWPDLIMTGGLKLLGGWGFGARFYDVNTKVNYQINQKQKIFLSYYSGGDKNFMYSNEGGVKTEYNMGWGNNIASLRWNSIWSSNLFSQCTAYYSNYADNEEMIGVGRTSLQKSTFADAGLNYQISVQINDKQTLKTGFELGNKTFMPYQYHETTPTGSKSQTANSETQQAAALFVEHETTLNKLTFNLGLRYDFINSKSLTNHSIQPRLSANYSVDEHLSLKAGIMKSTQSMHALRKSTNGSPIYTWIPATNRILPQSVWQYSVGANYKFVKNFNLDVEAYYKDIQNSVAAYDVPASAYAEINYDQLLHLGRGKAYGLEFLFEGKVSKSAFTTAYTLSRSVVQYDAYNGGNWFSSDFDITHTLIGSYTYTIQSSAKYTRNFSALFSANSGAPLTLPTQAAQNAQLPLQDFYFNNYQYIDCPNNAKMPFYHRLDINYQTTRHFKRGYRTWTFGIINLYNQQNTYLVVRNTDNLYKKITAFPIMPFISYKTEF